MRHNIIRAVAVVLMSALLISLALVSTGSTEIKLTYWDQFRPDPSGREPRPYALWRGLDLFQKIYPDIKVELEIVPWGVIETKLIPMAATGETPDVVHVADTFLTMHIEAGTIAPLDEYVKDWDTSDWMLGWDMWTVNGKIWAVPEDYQVEVLEYRADFLREAGLDVPKTWEDLGVAAAKLTTETRRGFSLGGNVKDLACNVNETLWPMIWDAGGEVFDKEYRLMYNNEAGLKVFQMLYDLRYKYNAMDESVINDDYGTIHSALRAGTLAMGTLGSHRVGTIRKQANLGEDFKLATLPSFQDGGLYGKGKPAPAGLAAWCLCIGKYAKYPEEGMLLIRWMSERIVKTGYAQAGIIPPRYPVYEDPWFQNETIEVRDLIYLRDYIRNYGKTITWPPWTLNYWKLVGQELQKMWLNRQSPQETLDSIERRYNEELLR